MGKVTASASMSLDGYIAKEDNTIGRLFDWYQNGEVEFPTASEGITMHLGPKSAEYWEAWVAGSVRSCVGGLCSTSPTGGADGTRWTCRSSS